MQAPSPAVGRSYCMNLAGKTQGANPEGIKFSWTNMAPLLIPQILPIYGRCGDILVQRPADALQQFKAFRSHFSSRLCLGGWTLSCPLGL